MLSVCLHHGSLLALRVLPSKMLLLLWVQYWHEAARVILLDNAIVEHGLDLVCLANQLVFFLLHLLYRLLHLLHLSELLLELFVLL